MLLDICRCSLWLWNCQNGCRSPGNRGKGCLPLLLAITNLVVNSLTYGKSSELVEVKWSFYDLFICVCAQPILLLHVRYAFVPYLFFYTFYLLTALCPYVWRWILVRRDEITVLALAKKRRCGMIANETTLHIRPKWHRNYQL